MGLGDPASNLDRCLKEIDQDDKKAESQIISFLCRGVSLFLSVVEVSFVGVSYGTVVGWVGVFICFCFAFPTFSCFGSILSLANRYFPL